jgi:DNA-binding SARP family transcriptional activator
MTLSLEPRPLALASKEIDEQQLGGWPCLTLLGGFGLELGGRVICLPMTARRVVAFLALQDRPLLRLYVAGSLWPETTEDRAGANLRSALWRLGRPGYALVQTTGGSLQLSPEVEVDVRRSLSLARRLTDRSIMFSEGEADELALCNDILPDWSEDWVIVEREHFRQLRLHALESLCEGLTAMGRFSDAVEAGLAAVAAEPLRESAHRTLIKTHLAEGNPGEAVHQYHVFRQLLQNELNLKPSEVIEGLIRGLTLVIP